MTATETATEAMLLVLSPLIGSFAGVVACRWPEGRSIVLGRSRCPDCRHPLSARSLVPIVSWLAQAARCRHCGRPISVFYPMVELAAFGIALWAVLVFDGELAVASAMLGWLLLILALIDLRCLVLPDAFVAAVLLLGLVVAAAFEPDDLASRLIGVAVGFAVFAAIAWGYQRLAERPGLGLGDAKLLAASGAWVGWSGVPSVILVASIVAISWVVLRSRGRGVTRTTRIAFGPYLALALWVVWAHGPILIG